MNERKSKTSRRRRRNCFDRLRARLLQDKRRRINPAAVATAQLMAIFSLIFGRIQSTALVPASTRYVPPPFSPGQTHRNEVARRLQIPTRYVDIVSAQGTVPYRFLFDHIRRGGPHREDAMSVLFQKAPKACRDWLDYVQRWGLWSRLLICDVHQDSEEDIDIRLLKSALAWYEVPKSGGGGPGPGGAGAVLKPATGSDENDPDDDPGGFKP